MADILVDALSSRLLQICFYFDCLLFEIPSFSMIATMKPFVNNKTEFPTKQILQEVGLRDTDGQLGSEIINSAVKRSIGSTTGCTITEKAPTSAFSWLKAPTSAFTFKTLLRHYAKQALTPRSLIVKLGLQRNYQMGQAGWLAKCLTAARPL